MCLHLLCTIMSGAYSKWAYNNLQGGYYGYLQVDGCQTRSSGPCQLPQPPGQYQYCAGADDLVSNDEVSCPCDFERLSPESTRCVCKNEENCISQSVGGRWGTARVEQELGAAELAGAVGPEAKSVAEDRIKAAAAADQRVAIALVKNEQFNVTLELVQADYTPETATDSEAFLQIVYQDAGTNPTAQCTVSVDGRVVLSNDLMTASEIDYTERITFHAPYQAGAFFLNWFEKVPCSEDRGIIYKDLAAGSEYQVACPPVPAETPDIVELEFTLDGLPTQEQVEMAIANVAIIRRSQIEMLNFVVRDNGDGGSVRQLKSNIVLTNVTLGPDIAARLEDKQEVGLAIVRYGGYMLYGDTSRTVLNAEPKVGQAPCWQVRSSVELEIQSAYCEVACVHGECTLTDTCSCEAGWQHSTPLDFLDPLVMDCGRPICPTVEGCTDGCCNGGNCTAPATCTCTTGWSGSNCSVRVCPPYWNETKNAAFIAAGSVGSACESGGLCVENNGSAGSHCKCSSTKTIAGEVFQVNLWAGDGCQLDVDECTNIAEQLPGCSSDSTCANYAGGYTCTCIPHYIGDGVYCYREVNLTLKLFPVFAGGSLLDDELLGIRAAQDVAHVLGVDATKIDVTSVHQAGAGGYLQCSFGMVVDRPPFTLTTQLAAAIEAAASVSGPDSVAIVGPNAVPIDSRYGVEFSAWVPVEDADTSKNIRGYRDAKLTLDAEATAVQDGTPERAEFERLFKTNIAQLAGVAVERVAVLSVLAGSAVVTFRVHDLTTPDVGKSAASALAALEASLAESSRTVAGYTAGGLEVIPAPPPPPPYVDEEAIEAAALEEPELRCYSVSEQGCVSERCSIDDDCRALVGLASPLGAACMQGFCDDGVEGLAADETRESNGAGSRNWCAAIFATAVLHWIC